MRLKRTPRPAGGTANRRRGAAPRRGSARGGGRQARRPGIPLRRRLGTRLPSIRRALAVLGALVVVGGLVAALNGPWLRVTAVGWTGGAYASDTEVAAVLEEQRGASLLAVDSQAVARALEELPAVDSARVEVGLTGTIDATLTDPAVAFVWENNTSRFLGAADGTLFVAEPLGELDEALASVPRIVDDRFAGRRLAVGDRLPAALLEAALRVDGIDPIALGSTATGLSVRLDDEFGFRVAAAAQGWEMALGVYGVDPNETPADAAARLESQVTAVRTLFASRPEASIGWVDVRNPGKGYFRAKS
jgi:cell division septal protein FtsQ